MSEDTMRRKALLTAAFGAHVLLLPIVLLGTGVYVPGLLLLPLGPVLLRNLEFFQDVRASVQWFANLIWLNVGVTLLVGALKLSASIGESGMKFLIILWIFVLTMAYIRAGMATLKRLPSKYQPDD